MDRWDTIVVGARCAGSPLARFLARAGNRVLVVDAASFPSDQPLSTHFIQPYGMHILDELGLGDRVRAIAPPVTRITQSVGGHEVRFRLPFGGCCPRRTELDMLLVEGAREAGAEVRIGHRVVDVVREGERVAGVIVEDRQGKRSELRADVVVGADGRNSTIADLVGAEKYLAYTAPRAAYWAYWPRPAWYAEMPYENSTFIAYADEDFRLVFPTDRDQLVIGMGFPRDRVEAWRKDPRGTLEARLREDPFFAKLIADTEPLGKVLGMRSIELFFRRAAGPGWALVGDAGLHKDPSAGLGISDALRDARALAAAIVEGGDAARERYWHQRDVASYALFHFARDLGDLDYDNPLNRMAFDKLATHPYLQDRVVESVERTRSPYDIFTPGEMLRWTFGAVLRGRFGVLRPFFRSARRAMAVQRYLNREAGTVPRPELAPRAS
jgi:flavin-dependent dehydrogenase